MSIESPELSENKSHPSIARRAVASIIDYALIFGITIVYIMYFGEEESERVYTVHGLKALVIPLLWFLYFVVAEAEFGQTLGHALFDMKVVRLDGESLHLSNSLKRHFLDPIDLFPFGLPAIIAASGNKDSQRIGDMFAQTKVIQTK